MLRAMLSVISAAGSAQTATDLQAPEAELARQSPHKPADCPHIVSVTLARPRRAHAPSWNPTALPPLPFLTQTLTLN